MKNSPENLFEKIKKEDVKFETPSEEIKFLKEELAKKEKEYISQDIEVSKEKLSHELIEEYKKVPVEKVVSKELEITKEESEGIALRLSPEKHDDIMSELLTILMEKGIRTALDIVEKMNNSHIQDDFHRFLIQYIASKYESPRIKSGSDLEKSLGLRLFEVTLPSYSDENKIKSFQDLTALMEQFLAGMQSISSSSGNLERNYFSLEIALSEDKDDIIFYIAVPKEKVDLLEKQVLGIYEEARVVEVFDDYNIFSEDGKEVAAYGKASVNEILQVKTYDKFTNDPLNVILNAFSKIKKEGEGLAIQFIIVPAGDTFIKRYGKVLDNLKKGDKMKDAMRDLDGFGKQFTRKTKELFSPIKTDSDKKNDSDRKMDDDAIQSVTEKLSSTIVQSNIRIVASAETKERAREILLDLESVFNQFLDTKGNGIIFEQVEDNRLKNTLHDFTFRMFDEEKAFRINLKELSTMYHFPIQVTSSAQLKQSKAGIAPAPSEIPQDGIVLGVNKYRHKETLVRFSPEDRMRHFYIIGQTGTGKTYFMKNQIRQDIENGDGVCFIDPHGSDIEDILSYIPEHRMDDVIYFNPAYTPRPMSLNMLEYDTRYPEQKSFVINELISIFNKLFDMKTSGGPMFEQYFRNAAGLVMEDPESGNTLLEIGRVLADKEFRQMKMSKSKNEIINQFWRNAEQTTGDQAIENFVPYITSKFDMFISNEIMRPVIAQEKSSFNMRDIMDNKKIFLVNLSKGRLGEINSNLIGLLLVGKILMAALSRVDISEDQRSPFYLYIDEFQNITTDSISQILSEARKYKLGLTIAHQFISQLDENIKNAVFGNVGSMAVFRISADDAKTLESRFAPIFSASDIMKLDNYNAYLQLLGKGSPLTPFNIETIEMPKGNKNIAEKVKELSYMKYGRDRAEVEADIMSRFRKI